MKRTLFVFGLVAILVLAMASVAVASGYNAYDSGTMYTKNPHGGYTATSNKCKTCHAVHKAIASSYKLLQNTSQATACDFCHIGAGAHTAKVVYAGTTPTTAPNGHTIGVTGAIPDNAAATSITTACSSCHTVHGANAILFASNPTKILKDTPLAGGTNVADTSTAYATAYGTRTAFCAACHDQNDDANISHPLAAQDGVTSFANAQKCLDCHDSVATPHGAATGYALLTGKDATQTASSAALDDVCRACHLNSGSTSGVGVTF
jgi:hypothetical protein